MQAGLDEVVGKIHGLEQRKAALLQELEALDRQLFKVRIPNIPLPVHLSASVSSYYSRRSC